MHILRTAGLPHHDEVFWPSFFQPRHNYKKTQKRYAEMRCALCDCCKLIFASIAPSRQVKQFNPEQYILFIQAY